MPALENTITTEEMTAGLNIEMVERFDHENDRLMEVLGIFDVETMAAGTVLNQLKITGSLNTAKVAEGDVTPLSPFEAKEIPVGSLEVQPYRKLTTAQAILKSGMVRACVKTDDKMIRLVRQSRLDDFFGYLAKGTLTAKGQSLQDAIAQADGALRTELEEHGDSTERIIHFVNTLDVADYLGSANITVQTVYGMQYIQSFLGLTDVFVTSRVAKGVVWATPVENIHIYAADFDELAKAGIQYEVSANGLIGVSHQECKERTGVETYVLTGMLIFAEAVNYIVKSTFGESDPAEEPDEPKESEDPKDEDQDVDAQSFDPDGDVMPTMENKVDEIVAFAKAHDISLTGASNKTQQLEMIAEAMAPADAE